MNALLVDPVFWVASVILLAGAVERIRDATVIRRTGGEMSRKARNDATTISWAPIVQNSHTCWVAIQCLGYTRREAKAKWLDGVDPRYHKKLLENVRFSRVVIKEETPP